MLAITGTTEDHDKTEAWIDQMGVEYTYGYFHGNQIGDATSQKGYPHAALVNPEGEIVWTGHPGSLNSGLIEDNLKGASKFISYGWSKEFESVAKAIHSSDYGAAIAAVSKLQEKGVEGAADVHASVMGMLDACVGDMNKALEAGDFLAAKNVADLLDGNLKGLAQESSVTAVFERLKSDKDAATILKGQESLEKIATSELRKKKQVEKAIGKAEKLIKKYPGTIVETQAKDFVARMKKRLRD